MSFEIASETDDRLMTREQLFAFLHEHGWPVGKGTWQKLCSPSIGKGPPIAGYWGKRPLYRPTEGLAWMRSLLSASPSRIHPGERHSVAA